MRQCCEVVLQPGHHECCHDVRRNPLAKDGGAFRKGVCMVPGQQLSLHRDPCTGVETPMIQPFQA